MTGRHDSRIAGDRRASNPFLLRFQTKPQIALDLIDRPKGNGLEVMGWTANELYGRDGSFLDGLDARGEAFVVEIPSNTHVWPTKPKRSLAWITSNVVVGDAFTGIFMSPF